ncbi:MAG: hypothetical protein K2I98_03310 [Prevotella sp.]|nr:hypothetical protein [Prevotella sp.]
MKRFCLIITLIVSTFSAANAGGITGKWKCSKEFIDGLGLYYDQMKGHYKFKKNGTFIVEINGVERTVAFSEVSRGLKAKFIHANHRQMYIKVKGTYKIVNDSISTTVRPEDVKCYIQPGQDYPAPPDANDNRYTLAEKEWKQDLYDKEVFWSETQAQTVKNELMHIWIWNKEPVTVNKKTLTIGNKTTFTRK